MCPMTTFKSYRVKGGGAALRSTNVVTVTVLAFDFFHEGLMFGACVCVARERVELFADSAPRLEGAN